MKYAKIIHFQLLGHSFLAKIIIQNPKVIIFLKNLKYYEIKKTDGPQEGKCCY